MLCLLKPHFPDNLLVARNAILPESQHSHADSGGISRAVSLTVRIGARVPNPVDQLIVAVEVSRVVLQVLRRSRRVIDRETRELHVSGPVVDQAQIPKATPGMLSGNCVGPGALSHGQIPRLGVSCLRSQDQVLRTCTYKGSSTPSEAVASLANPAIQELDSVKVIPITASGEYAEAPAVMETWPAMFLPKSKVTADDAKKVAVALMPLRRPPGLLTVPFTL